MTSVRNTIVLAAFLGGAAAASAAPVRHAGEWETSIDGGKPLVACATHDTVFDKNSVPSAMAKVPNAKCTTTNFSKIGPLTTFSIQCEVYGAHMVSSGSMTQTGPDTFTVKSHTHVDGGALKIPNGQSIPMPDQDMTMVSHRTGACKPGDRMMSN
jgi:hypothetical protein